MKNCDVLIIGGGPAGSSLAWGLRDSNKRIIIMDKAVFPRNKVCAGWITPAVLGALEIDGQDYRRHGVMQEIRGFRVGTMNSATIDIVYNEQPISYGVRRCEFDKYLLKRSGSNVIAGQIVKSIRKQGQYWIVNDQICTTQLVGAGGNFCPVARYLGAKIGKTEIAVRAQEAEFEMTPEQIRKCGISAELPELYFCDDMQGYGWIFRKGNFMNIGLGREDCQGLPGHFRNFLDFLEKQKKIAADMSCKSQGHGYLLYHHSRRPLAKDGILLIGDAAGLAYPQSGEGIRPAIESGLLAADAIRQAEDGVGSIENNYRRLIEERFGKRQISKSILSRLPLSLRQHISNKLLHNHWFLRNILLDRWFLHRKRLAADPE